MNEEDAARWWAGILASWGYTSLSEEWERCTVCDRRIRRAALALLAHHDWHLAKQRHPSNQA